MLYRISQFKVENKNKNFRNCKKDRLKKRKKNKRKGRKIKTK